MKEQSTKPHKGEIFNGDKSLREVIFKSVMNVKGIVRASRMITDIIKNHLLSFFTYLKETNPTVFKAYIN